MSLYNILFGESPVSQLLLDLLGLEKGDFYRYRDCYLTKDGDIEVFTRGGGGNRECVCNDFCSDDEMTEVDAAGDKHAPGCVVLYHEKNQAHPNYKYDCDDDYDCTYASFVFSVPEPAKELINILLQTDDTKREPSKMFKDLISRLKSKNDKDLATRRTLEVSQKILETIERGKGGCGHEE